MKRERSMPSYRQLIELMVYLGYPVYTNPTNHDLSTRADYVAIKLADTLETPMLSTQIAEGWGIYGQAQKRAVSLVTTQDALCRDWDCPTRHSCARFLVTDQVLAHNRFRAIGHRVMDSCRAEFTAAELQDGCPAYIEVPMPT